MTTSHRITLLPGDGIGLEVVPAAVRVLDAVAERHGVSLAWEEHPWGAGHYREHGRMMPLDAIDTMRHTDAILLGAVGDPAISDVETLWGMLIPIRRSFDQYINLRPIQSLPGVRSPLVDPDGIDLVIVRENVEGEYSEVGGRTYAGTDRAAAYQQAVFTEFGIERVTRYAGDLARARSGRLTSATKSNGIIHTMTFWDEVVAKVAAETEGVALESMLIDALAASIVLHPQRFDVIVASNLFGDILSDIAAAAVGSIGVAPSANLNPERKHPSLFEPVHGSAPDIAGKGIANPLGTIWAGMLMLDHLGHADAAAELKLATNSAITEGAVTSDLGGDLDTEAFASGVIAALAHGES